MTAQVKLAYGPGELRWYGKTSPVGIFKFTSKRSSPTYQHQLNSPHIIATGAFTVAVTPTPLYADEAIIFQADFTRPLSGLNDYLVASTVTVPEGITAGTPDPRQGSVYVLLTLDSDLVVDTVYDIEIQADSALGQHFRLRFQIKIADPALLGG